jgi:hypothetical protein
MDDQHLLAVVCHRVFAVGHNSIGATTTRDDVLYRGHVVAYEYVVAVSAREEVVFRTLADGTVDDLVTTSFAHHAVGASETVDEVPAFPAHYCAV